jgi:hypothetical protein
VPNDTSQTLAGDGSGDVLFCIDLHGATVAARITNHALIKLGCSVTDCANGAVPVYLANRVAICEIAYAKHLAGAEPVVAASDL